MDLKVPMAELLNMCIEGNKYSIFGNVYCPFHENFDTPAAKIYESSRGDTLYCFSERRAYRPSHVFEKGLIAMSLEDMFWSVWSSLVEAEKDYLVANSEVSYQVKVSGLEKIEGFSRGRMCFEDVLRVLVEEVKVEVV